MKRVIITQDTPEWLQWRKSGIGASDVNTIIGCDEYKTPYQLWAELNNLVDKPDLSRNLFIKHGKHYEKFARNLYERYSKHKFTPICVESTLFPILHSSLDGYNSILKQILEIKCPTLKVFNEVAKNGRLSKSFRKYYTQVQYQLFVADEAESAILAFYLPATDFESEKIIKFEIYPDPIYQDWIVNKVLKFWDCVFMKKEPERDPDRDILTPELLSEPEIQVWSKLTIDLLELMEKRKTLEKQISSLKAQESLVKEKIFTCFGNFKQGSLGGVKIKVSARNGRVNIEEIIEDISALTGVNINLENYRGKGSISVSVSIDGLRGRELEAELISQKISNLKA